MKILPFNCREETCRGTGPNKFHSDPCGIRLRRNSNVVQVAYASAVTPPSTGEFYVDAIGSGGARKRARNPGRLTCAPPRWPFPPVEQCVQVFDVADVPRPRPIPEGLFAKLRPYSEVEKYDVRLKCFPYMAYPCVVRTEIPVWDGDMVVEAYRRARQLAVAVSTTSTQYNASKAPLKGTNTARVFFLDFAIRGASTLFSKYLESATKEPRVFKDYGWVAAMSCIMAEKTLEAFQEYAQSEVHTGQGDFSQPRPEWKMEFERKGRLKSAWLEFFELGDIEIPDIGDPEYLGQFLALGRTFGNAHLVEPVARIIRERGVGPCWLDDVLQLWFWLRAAQAQALDNLVAHLRAAEFAMGAMSGKSIRPMLATAFKHDWFDSMSKAFREGGEPQKGDMIKTFRW